MSQAHMNQETFEVLSAGVDGELSPHELRFLLRRLDHDVALQHAWSRYHLVRDGLRGRLPPLADRGFAARVSAAIEREELPTAARSRHWLRWSAGGAIAASVAAVTLMVGQPANDVRTATAQSAQQADPALASASSSHTAAVPSAVPPWLSGGSAGLLSQPASATLGSPFARERTPAWQSRQDAAYPPLYRYRTLDTHDGSYLLLLDPAQSAAADAAPRHAAQ